MAAFIDAVRRDIIGIDMRIDNSLVQLAALSDPSVSVWATDLDLLLNNLRHEVIDMKDKSEMEYFSLLDSSDFHAMAHLALYCVDEEIRQYYLNKIEKYRAWWRREARADVEELVKRRVTRCVSTPAPLGSDVV
jgi:hypothetical protein